MALYISGSNRIGNCSRILNDLKENDDTLILLAEKSINYCLGCNACQDNLKEYCIVEDDMQEIYNEMVKTNKIVIATPIYMNHITGLLKNVIDRFNPYSCHNELLQGKTIYLITVGQMDEKENKDVANHIKEYFESIGEFMNFDVIFLKNFSSGDIEKVDDVTKMYDNYAKIIDELKKQIGK